MQSTTGRYRVLLAVVGLIAVAVLAGAVVLWPRGELARPATAGQADSTRYVSATLTKVVRLDCEEADPGVPGSICIKATAGPASGSAWPRASSPACPPPTASRTWNGADPCSSWPPCS